MVDDIKRADPTGDIDVSGFASAPPKSLPLAGRFEPNPAASGGQAAVIYDKLRDELAVAKQRLSDQEEVLATARYHLDLRAALARRRAVGE